MFAYVGRNQNLKDLKVSAAILCTGGGLSCEKEAGPFYRASSSVRLWWEFTKPKRPKGPKGTPDPGSGSLHDWLELLRAQPFGTTMGLQPTWGPGVCVSMGTSWYLHMPHRRTTLQPLAASCPHWRAGSLRSLTVNRKEDGLFGESFQRKVKDFF